MPCRRHMEDRDMLLVPMRGAIHAHQRHTAAPARNGDDWTDAALHRSHKSSALPTFVSIIQLVSPKRPDDWRLTAILVY